jgi:3-hydroxyacyl-CoA dehydrogenase
MEVLDIGRPQTASHEAGSDTHDRRAVHVTRSDGVEILRLDASGLSATVRAALLQALRSASATHGTVAIVIAGTGDRLAGDVALPDAHPDTAHPDLRELVEAIESCPHPVVAALGGITDGDGVELALGCDARVCSADAVLRLPQVTLGLLPRAGGTQLLPRIVGRAAAVEIICSGRAVCAVEALSCGIVDAVSPGDPLDSAVVHARRLAPFKRRLRDRPVAADDESFEAAAAAARLAGHGRPSVDAALTAIRASATEPRDAAATLEHTLAEALRSSHDARALRYRVQARRRAAPFPMADALAQTIESIGIVGAGALGLRLAEAFAQAGLQVTLVERDRRVASTATKRLKRLRQSNVRVAGALSAIAGCDFVVEAAVEDYDTKASIFIALDELLPGDRIIATTTAGVDIDALAAVTRRTRRICGMHLVPTADTAAVVEVVRCIDTSPDTLATAVGLSRRIGLLPVIVGNAYGYIGRRMQGAVEDACTLMVHEGKQPDQVRDAMRRFGFSDWFIARVSPDPASPPTAREEDDGVIDRIMLALANEAACLLEDGVASAASDIDVLLTDAYGFPPWEGGPGYWASQRSLHAMVAARDSAFAGGARVRRGRLELLQE